MVELSGLEICAIFVTVANMSQFVLTWFERRKYVDLLAARNYTDYATGQKIMRKPREGSAPRDPYLEYASSPLVE